MTELSRREFLRVSAAGLGPGTALGSLVGLGASLAPVTARAQQLRIKDAKATPSLCPKGAAIYQLHKNPNRATKVLHRKPGAPGWEEVELEWAMDRVAELVKK